MKPEPITDAQLFDVLAELFGIGDWDPDLDDMAYFRMRTTEIAKIKAIRRKRNYSITEFAALARYVHSRGHRIARTWDLLEYWPEFRRSQAANARLQSEAEFERALEIERARPDGQGWAERLLMSYPGPGRDAVMREWREERT